MPYVNKRNSGFALIIVIWGLGIITLLVLSFLTNGRQRVLLAFNVANSIKASYLADGETNRASFKLLSQQSSGINNNQSPEVSIYNGEPTFCTSEGSAVVTAIEQENGKVDLNAAPLELLEALLRGFGVDPKTASAVANNIIIFRTSITDGAEPSLSTGEKPFQPKRTNFETVLELDQVEGVSAELFRLLTPFLTINSHGVGIDIQTAPPALLAALSGAPIGDVLTLVNQPFPNQINRKNISIPNEFKQPGEAFTFTVHTEVLMPNGVTASRDTILDFGGGNPGKYLIKEIRRGRSLYTDRLRDLINTQFAHTPSC